MNFEEISYVFREYDIRGKSGKELNYDFARKLGWAYSEFLNVSKGSWVSVGRDVRLSSDELFSGLVQGLNEGGLNVFDIGVVPTPVLYFSLFELDVAGGVMITASHNPPDENGFKICKGRSTIAEEDIKKLYEIFVNAENPRKEGSVKYVNIKESYKKRLIDEFSELKNSNLKVVVDAGNGAAGPLAVSILSELGIEILPLCCEPDGRFPVHMPDPTLEKNMSDCVRLVSEGGYDLGIGFDGDGDRLGVVDETGKLLFGDRLLVLFSREVLKRNPGAKVVAEVKCTNFLFEEIRRKGGIPIIWKAGHSLIKKKMAEEGALLGGEMSGHFFFKDRYFGFDDALYASLRVLEIASDAKAKGLRFSELLSDLPDLYSTEEIRIPVPEDKKNLIVEELKEELVNADIPGFLIKDVIDIDGIRVNYDHGWGLLRPSNTQAVVVVRLEADSPEGLNLLKRYFLGAVENKLREYS